MRHVGAIKQHSGNVNLLFPFL